MNSLIDHIQVGNYLCFTRTDKIAYIEAVHRDANDGPLRATQLLVTLVGPSGRRHHFTWYQLLELTRPATALEVLSKLGNEPEVVDRGRS